VDDAKQLTELNEQFIDAWRKGQWELLQPILSDNFVYLDGATGEVVQLPEYEQSLLNHPAPSITIDQVAIHVDGAVAVVSARTSRAPGQYKRYVDTYERRENGWICVHACVWPLS
jgi:hypothetical protein